MNQMFEDLEARRLDLEAKRLELAERELVTREKALELEVTQYQLGIDDQIGDRAQRRAQREAEHADWQAHREAVEASTRQHGELLDRIAKALEAISEHRIPIP